MAGALALSPLKGTPRLVRQPDGTFLDPISGQHFAADGQALQKALGNEPPEGAISSLLNTPSNDPRKRSWSDWSNMSPPPADAGGMGMDIQGALPDIDLGFLPHDGMPAPGTAPPTPLASKPRAVGSPKKTLGEYIGDLPKSPMGVRAQSGSNQSLMDFLGLGGGAEEPTEAVDPVLPPTPAASRGTAQAAALPGIDPDADIFEPAGPVDPIPATGALPVAPGYDESEDESLALLKQAKTGAGIIAKNRDSALGDIDDEVNGEVDSAIAGALPGSGAPADTSFLDPIMRKQGIEPGGGRSGALEGVADVGPVDVSGDIADLKKQANPEGIGWDQINDKSFFDKVGSAIGLRGDGPHSGFGSGLFEDEDRMAILEAGLGMMAAGGKPGATLGGSFGEGALGSIRSREGRKDRDFRNKLYGDKLGFERSSWLADFLDKRGARETARTDANKQDAFENYMATMKLSQDAGQFDATRADNSADRQLKAKQEDARIQLLSQSNNLAGQRLGVDQDQGNGRLYNDTVQSLIRGNQTFDFTTGQMVGTPGMNADDAHAYAANLYRDAPQSREWVVSTGLPKIWQRVQDIKKAGGDFDGAQREAERLSRELAAKYRLTLGR